MRFRLLKMNFLVNPTKKFDENDNIKLCDFGWSTYLRPDEKRKTYAGTMDYMAPELH